MIDSGEEDDFNFRIRDLLVEAWTDRFMEAVAVPFIVMLSISGHFKRSCRKMHDFIFYALSKGSRFDIEG